MESSNSLQCPICYMQYNDDTNTPRIIPCGNGHSVCSVCILTLMKRPDKKFCCPLDRVTVILVNKDLSAFPPNLALRDFIRDLGKSEFCQTHSLNKADLVCLQCRVKICYMCEKQNHRGHKTELLEEIMEKKREKVLILGEWVHQVQEITDKKDKILGDKQAELMQAVENQFKIYFEELEIKKARLEEGIQKYISNLKAAQTIGETGPHTQVFGWQKETQDKLGNLDLDDPEEIPFDIFDQEDVLNMLDLQGWVKDQKLEIDKILKEISQVSVNFDEKFLDLLKNTPVGEFNPEPEQKKRQNSKEKQEENKFEIEKQCVEEKQQIIQPINEPRSQNLKAMRWVREIEKENNRLKNPEKNVMQNDIGSQPQKEDKNIKPAQDWSKMSFEEKDRRSQALAKIIDSIREACEGLDLVIDMTKSYGLKIETAGWKLINDSSAAQLNQILDDIPEDIKQTIFEVNFSCENLTDNGLDLLGQLIYKLPYLTKLQITFLKSSSMHPNGLQRLEDCLPRLQNLTELSLVFTRWAHLTDKSMILLSNKISSAKNLKYLTLNFSECHKVNNYAIKESFKTLAKLNNLKKLNLLFRGCKNVDNTYLEEIGKSYSKMKNLEQLMLDFGRSC